MPLRLGASLLSADPLRIGEQIKTLHAAGIHFVHLDIMDHYYVPFVGLNSKLCSAIHMLYPDWPIDVHLMVKECDAYLASFIDAGATQISFHLDSTQDVYHTCKFIQNRACRAGIALTPQVPIKDVEPYLSDINFILVLSVTPGQSGQTFEHHTYAYIQALIALLELHNIPPSFITTDGGMTPAIIRRLSRYGIKSFISGHMLFSNTPLDNVLNEILTIS